jgi:sugar fermentation stimulation protein A
MIFKDKLISGHFIKRYKRFFIDVKIGSNIVTAHCPNTGSMLGLLKKGNRVWLSKSDDLNRKLKFTVQIIEDRKTKVGINTHLTNKIVLNSLLAREIKDFRNFRTIRREVKFGENTRFDFLLINGNKKVFIEVKNVTLSRHKGIAEFPDAVTSRGLKHIKELLNAKKEGYDIYLFYVVQRDDCNKFDLAKDIDPEYCELLVKAVKKKLKILCFDCKFSSKGIKLNREIKIKI